MSKDINNKILKEKKATIDTTLLLYSSNICNNSHVINLLKNVRKLNKLLGFKDKNCHMLQSLLEKTNWGILIALPGGQM